MVKKYSELTESEKEKRRESHRKWAAKNDRSQYYKDYEKVRPERSKQIKREYTRRYIEEHKEELREKDRQRRINATPEQRLAADLRKSRLSVMLSGAKKRAQREGLPFNIEHSDIEHDFVCKCCGKQMAHNLGNGKSCYKKDSPSLDKLIPALGYVKGNVQVICHECNSYKRDQSIERVQLMIEYMKKYSPRV